MRNFLYDDAPAGPGRSRPRSSTDQQAGVQWHGQQRRCFPVVETQIRVKKPQCSRRIAGEERRVVVSMHICTICASAPTLVTMRFSPHGITMPTETRLTGWTQNRTQLQRTHLEQQQQRHHTIVQCRLHCHVSRCHCSGPLCTGS